MWFFNVVSLDTHVITEPKLVVDLPDEPQITHCLEDLFQGLEPFIIV